MNCQQKGSPACGYLATGIIVVSGSECAGLKVAEFSFAGVFAAHSYADKLFQRHFLYQPNIHKTFYGSSENELIFN